MQQHCFTLCCVKHSVLVPVSLRPASPSHPVCSDWSGCTCPEPALLYLMHSYLQLGWIDIVWCHKVTEQVGLQTAVAVGGAWGAFSAADFDLVNFHDLNMHKSTPGARKKFWMQNILHTMCIPATVSKLQEAFWLFVCFFFSFGIWPYTFITALPFQTANCYPSFYWKATQPVYLDRAWELMAVLLAVQCLSPVPVTKTCPGSAFWGSSSWHSLTVTGGMDTKQPDDDSMGDGNGAGAGQCSSP